MILTEDLPLCIPTRNKGRKNEIRNSNTTRPPASVPHIAS